MSKKIIGYEYCLMYFDIMSKQSKERRKEERNSQYSKDKSMFLT